MTFADVLKLASNKKLLVTKGIATSNKKLLIASGIATRSKDAICDILLKLSGTVDFCNAS